MASLDSLPGDQRAVIQLVLGQRRSYDDIATLLSIDRAGVRQRALDAFDALGPGNSIPAPQRALLTDYLLGQLPGPVADQIHDRIADSPSERAWLRVVASEVAPLAADDLPEIPGAGAERRAGFAPVAAAAASAASAASAAPAERTPMAAPPAAPSAQGGAGAGARGGSGAGAGAAASAGAGAGASRRGGAIVLGLAALIIAAVVVVILVSSGGASKKLPSTAAASTGSSGTATSTTSTTSTTASKAKLVGQVNLNSPTGNKNLKGIAQVIKEGSTLGVLIVATHVPANTTHNAYAVWLYNSSSDAELAGFVSTRVGKSEKLETDGPLPSNASHYKEMLITLETHNNPKSPGPILLKGPMKIT